MTAEILPLPLPDHESRHWLEVVFCRTRGARLTAGWYVRRTCACCKGKTVTLPKPSRESAERAIEVMDELHRRFPGLARRGGRR
jgi:hypothetical protein